MDILKELKHKLNDLNIGYAEYEQYISGNPLLDIYTLGLPKFTAIFGEEGTLKTTLGIQLSLSFLRQFKNAIVLYLDSEGAFSARRMKMLGYTDDELNRVVVVNPPFTIQDVTKILLELREIVRHDKVFVLWDSVNQTPSKEEYEYDKIGMHARALSSELRKFPQFYYYAIAQFRENIQPFSSIEIPVGRALRHRSDLTLFVSDAKINIPMKLNEIAFKKITFVIKKSRNISSGYKFESIMLTTSGLHFYYSLLFNLLKYKIIEKPPRKKHFEFQGKQIQVNDIFNAANIKNYLDLFVDAYVKELYDEDAESVRKFYKEKVIPYYFDKNGVLISEKILGGRLKVDIVFDETQETITEV